MIKIPQSELEVMKVIWENTQPVSSKIITTTLKELNGWESTTTFSFLSRLIKRGFLDAEKKDKFTYYTAKIEKEPYIIFITKNFILDVFDKNIESKDKLNEIIHFILN